MTDAGGTEANAPQRRICRDLEFRAVQRILADGGIHVPSGMGFEETHTAQVFFEKRVLKEDPAAASAECDGQFAIECCLCFAEH